MAMRAQASRTDAVAPELGAAEALTVASIGVRQTLIAHFSRLVDDRARRDQAPSSPQALPLVLTDEFLAGLDLQYA